MKNIYFKSNGVKGVVKISLLSILLITSIQSAIPQKVCKRACSSHYSGKNFKICQYACGYGDMIYVLKERWIRSSDCNTIVKKEFHHKYKSACKKGVRTYLNYFDQ